MGRFAEALQSIAATLWVGAMWGIGYIVAPVLFSRLGDRALAGLIAGKLFSLIAWVGIGCAIYLLLFRMLRSGTGVFRQGVFWIALLMLPKQVMESVLRDRFAAWHGVSSVLYIIQSLLGAALVVLLGRSK